jgi:hypothetical protein
VVDRHESWRAVLLDYEHCDPLIVGHREAALMADGKEVDVRWLVNPKTGEHVALTYLENPAAPWLKEVRTDARVLAGTPVVDGRRATRDGLLVRADELMSSGFVPVPFSSNASAADAGLAGLPPWRDWFELAERHDRLVQSWGSWGAPEAATARLASHITSVRVCLDGCGLGFGSGSEERWLFMSQPLASGRLAEVPQVLHPFLRAHGRLEVEADDDITLVLGWNAVEPEQAEFLVEALAAGTSVIGSVSGGTLLATPSGELIHLDDESGEVTHEPLASGLLRWIDRAVTGG